MKIKSSDADRFAARPDARVRAVLVYGPDSGLIRERMNALAKSVLDDLADPFRVSDLTDADLRQDPARLADEAAAIAMLGGRRIVRVRGAGDTLAKTFEGFLADPKGDALIIVEGSDLGPRSSLRKLFEENASAAAIPCYADDAATLEDTIRKRLARDGLAPEPAALHYLTSHLGSDRGVTMNELEKLALYMHPGTGPAGSALEKTSGEKRTVTLADVRACVGDNAETGLDDVVDAATGGDLAALDVALARARSADLSPIALLNALSRHLIQLHLALGEIETGTPADAALRAIRPPVHFSRAGALRRQLGLWNRRRLDRALTLVADADTQCKTTGLPENAICGQTLLRIAQAARAGARG
ncbi:MAG: DNA polymerase III subunit delta [Parvibaculum sp.]|uniref:DNA polymerase III subunit delta n=1 Tax=Parvibaculum sp. TaxID=2024848 RepID=UPI0025D7AF41|nr:DNA polymerase III subunit delta [Parvibaculum sp.]MCE9648058.1 DNA polymerase III subunit delta [Parvibaculum sp.]